ncbi:MAG: hypothetical protein RI952_809 [Bacteroidota bacterium]|jgi:hypothetical protein
MTKITNLESLDQEIIRLKEAANAKEANINEAFQQLSSSLEPANIISSGIKSLVNRSPLSKPLISTGISLLSGLFIEKVILKNSNFLVKYGIAQIAMSVISNFVDEKWNPSLITKLKDSIAQVIDQQKSTNQTIPLATEQTSEV